MLSQSSSLACLPKEIWVTIFERTGSHPSLCTVSKAVQRIMETVYANLYRDYQFLNHPYLNGILQQVNRNQAEMPALSKVRLVYQTTIKQLSRGKVIKHSTLAEYEEIVSATHLQTLVVRCEAASLIACFSKISRKCHAAKVFLKALAEIEDAISEATHIQAWMPDNAALLQQVIDLYLSNLGLTHLPEEIKYLMGLQDLFLEYNALTFLPSEIGYLTQLRELNLDSNQLTSLPKEIGNLAQLHTLHLSDNQLTSLPKEIGNLVQLQHLALWENQLTNLPPEIGKLAQLHNLYLSGNQLKSLPSEIGNLVQLQHLALWENQLTNLPPEIGNLAQLQSLTLFGNQLKSLPPEIGNLDQLRELNLRGNQLKSLPSEIGNLVQLQDLVLRENQFTSLPRELVGLEYLEHLTLSHNPGRKKTFPKSCWILPFHQLLTTQTFAGYDGSAELLDFSFICSS